MHPNDLINCQKFIDKYIKTNNKINKVLDVGSLNINGTIKSLFELSKYEYIGIDIFPGKNVDIVLENPYTYPFVDNNFDITISNSCFQHNELFWVSFKEMVRVTKSEGYIYINSPFKWELKNEFVDCWRFLLDGFKAMSKWCPQAEFIEGYRDGLDPCVDFIGIFKINK